MAKSDQNILDKLKSIESPASMLLGIIVVFVVGALLFTSYKNTGETNQTDEPGQKVTNEEMFGDNQEVKGGKEYQVQAGESLWKISLNHYGSGYYWPKIAAANSLSNPDVLLVDQILVLPEITVETQADESRSSIVSDSYVVQKGDSLWGISVRAYQDGYQWPKIAQANALANPNLIHQGNNLVIPR